MAITEIEQVEATVKLRCVIEQTTVHPFIEWLVVILAVGMICAGVYAMYVNWIK